jgi:hypothetical protein
LRWCWLAFLLLSQVAVRLFNFEQTVRISADYRRAASLLFGSAPSRRRTVADGTKMKLGYNVFRRLEDGSPVWVANVDTLAEAKQKLISLNRNFPGEYFIHDAETGAILNEVKDPRPDAASQKSRRKT